VARCQSSVERARSISQPITLRDLRIWLSEASTRLDGKSNFQVVCVLGGSFAIVLICLRTLCQHLLYNRVSRSPHASLVADPTARVIRSRFVKL